MSEINSLWTDPSEAKWKAALKKYNDFIISSQVAALDAELDPLDLGMIESLGESDWYDFLYYKYFPWKYTAPNRLATTRASLERHRNRTNGLSDLNRIKSGLVKAPVKNTDWCLKMATSIGGLGVAGASGLLALMHPAHFGTVDEFLVLALSEVKSLPEHSQLLEQADRINRSKTEKKSYAITQKVGVLLIEIMRRKAVENNQMFNSNFWTPRQIDKVLWAFGHL